MEEDGRPLRLFAALLCACAALALALGIARVLVQRADPPEWALRNQNTYEGYVTIDGYARTAERFAAWMRGEDPGAEALHACLRDHPHPIAVLVPALVGAVSLALGSIPLGFLLLSALAFLALLAVAAKLGAALAPEEPRAAALLAGVLVAGHFFSARVAGALILDPFVALFAALAALLALRRVRGGGRRTAAALFATQLLGSFLKLSYMPFLAAPALVTLFAAERARWRRAAVAGLAFGLLPALPLALYLHLVPELEILSAESDMATVGWILRREHVVEWALELALLLQFLPWILTRRGALRAPAVRALLAAAAPAALAAHLIRPPINPRLLYPPLVLLLVAAVPALLRRFPGRALTRPLALYVALNLALAAAGLALLLRG